MSKHGKRSVAVVLAAGVIGLAAWGLLPDTPAQAQEPDPATLLYVNNMTVAHHSVTGPRRRPDAFVEIVDGYGRPVNGVLVVGDWSGCFKEKGDSALTQTICYPQEDGTEICFDGWARIDSKRTYSCWGKAYKCSFTFTVTGVSQEGMTYVPVAGMTTASTPCF